MTSILIIGSKGFIGKHAEDYFSALDNVEVNGADIVIDYNKPNYHIIDPSTSDFKNVFKSHSFDFCINCSGAANVSQSMTKPSRDYYLNTFNVFKILEAIRVTNNNCKFINLSSAAVYGNPNSLPISETEVTHPISPYGWHKLQSEMLCKEFFEQFEIPTISLRIFSVFGPGLKKQLFWDLYKKALGNEEIELWGTGNESRDFIYISDLIKVIHIIIEHGAFKGEAINVSNGEEIFINDAVKYFYSSFDKKIKYRFKGNHRPGDPNNWKANIEMLKGLGYKQEVPFEKGLDYYYQWVQTQTLS